jgi:predicted TIM-barrel fold metal-dependent hydrolase
MNIVQAAADLVWSKMLRKYPDLKVALSEGGIGWIPYFLERIDYNYDRHHAWTGQDFGDRLPSEIFNEHVLTCFIDDKFGLASREHLNMDMVTWECDYPHSDSNWPKSPEVLAQSVLELNDEEIDKVTHLNAMRQFSYDPFQVLGGREQCTVEALRRQVEGHDVTIRAQRRAGDNSSRTTAAADLIEMAMSRSE